MKTKAVFFLFSLLLSGPLAARAARTGDGSEGYYSFLSGCDASRITQSADMDRLLRAASVRVGYQLRLNSCYRSQAHQESILQRHRCLPNYGPNNCNGTVARQSQHTVGVAADFHTQLGDQQLCTALDQARKEARGGVGGVGGYGGGYAHLDVRPYHCNWNVCKKYLGPCTGHGISTYVSTIVDRYERKRMLEYYRAELRDSANDETNPDNVEDFFLLRLLKGVLNMATLGAFNLDT